MYVGVSYPPFTNLYIYLKTVYAVLYSPALFIIYTLSLTNLPWLNHKGESKQTVPSSSE